jgi:hypothetical protein
MHSPRTVGSFILGIEESAPGPLRLFPVMKMRKKESHRSPPTRSSTSQDRKKWRVEFQTFLDKKDRPAHKALQRLLNSGCDGSAILLLLHRECVETPSVMRELRVEAASERQSASGLADDMERLSKKLESFYGRSDFVKHLTDPRRKEIAAGAIAPHLPSLIRYYALCFKTYRHPNFYRELRARGTDLVVLACYVKDFTGRECYPYLSLLYNAALRFSNRPSNAAYPDTIRKAVNRFKKSHPQTFDRIVRLVAQHRNGAAGSEHLLVWLSHELDPIPRDWAPRTHL